MKSHTPPEIRPPFAHYSHGIEVGPGARWLFSSGQLGLAPDDSLPEGAEAQAERAFANLDAVLASAGMTRADVVRLNSFVTAREHMAGYMAARDHWVAGLDPAPASTLVIVAGFTRPEFVVEIEMTAAREP